MNLDDVFGADGALAERLPGFTYRAAQQRMAELVVAALESGRHAVIEAGTGIGKTFAYLLPLLLLERRAIISTGTHTLQDQLFGRDLPLLGAIVGRPMRVAVLKGRGNYLCWHRLDTARRDITEKVRAFFPERVREWMENPLPSIAPLRFPGLPRLIRADPGSECIAVTSAVVRDDGRGPHRDWPAG